MRTPLSQSSSDSPHPNVICRICGKPVSIGTAKTDAAGQAIHEECFVLKVKLEQASRDEDGHSTRPWKSVATEVCSEQNPKKMTELLLELNQARDEQKLDGTPKVLRDDYRKPDGK